MRARYASGEAGTSRDGGAPAANFPTRGVDVTSDVTSTHRYRHSRPMN